MADHIIGDADRFEDGAGIVVELAGRSIGVFRRGDDFYALLNFCPHQGGPVCEGGVYPLSRGESVDGKIREWYDADSPVVACPWHGWEFDLVTGVCVADAQRRIATYPVAVRDGKVVVSLPDRGGVAPAAASSS